MKRSSLALVALAIAYVAIAVGLEVPSGSPAGYSLKFVVSGFGIPVLLYAWCQSDINDGGFSYPSGAPLLVAFLFPVGLPVYFFRTRSWPKALLCLVYSVLFIFACEIMAAIGRALHARIT